jgi:hypothetical protein
MRTKILTLTFILFTGLLFGQNENPYSQFGYEAPVMPEKERPQMQNKMDRLYLLNSDTVSAVHMLAIDPLNGYITFFNKEGLVLQTDTLSKYTMARWLSADPYGQFNSPYVGMGNNPVMGVDPDGGWLSMFNVKGALIGAAVGAGVGLAVDKDNWGWYALGGAAGGGFLSSDFAKVNVWGTHDYSGLLPSKSGRESIRYMPRAVEFKNDYFKLLILHDPWHPGEGSWGKLDGHVFMLINGKDYSFRPTGNPGDKLNSNLWNSKGWIGSAPGYARETRNAENSTALGPGYSHTELLVKTTTAKKNALLQNIAKASLNPPNYSFIGKRCAGFAMKMMRRSDIVPWHSKFNQFTPRTLERFMQGRDGVSTLFQGR